ncbi:hypothetical protein IVG45_01795 [Methylomonas sp. LL1]|uniref:YciC family protein n=1 Tax=Methylomonas sp. LL1 TaxID=2785785 RepID=UPI0018C428A0|nr:YciC family protein [Methylomonas sp. LL1]QPK63736.1 hypothetical protein IVG45_01795 [Methylomonas sp. LL1]
MRLLASEPVSIAKVLDTSIKLYAAGFNKQIGILSILAVLYIAMALLTVQLQPDPATITDVATEFPIGHLPLLGFIAVFSILSFVLYAALIYRVDNVANGRQDSFMEAISVGFGKFPAMFLALILYVLAVMLGTLLLIIPGLILMLSLAFYLYFIVIDSYGGYSALRASHSLVWGHWWRTMAIFTVPMAIWMAVLFTLGFLLALLVPGNPVLMQVLMNVLSVFFTPYFFTLGYVLFNDLKLRKSGSDLASRLAR